jgi:hypothetical protein
LFFLPHILFATSGSNFASAFQSEILFLYFMKIYILLCLLSPFSLTAGGIKGSVKNNKGEALSFASILVKGTNKGTMANEEGKYELTLEPGRYEIVFQYLSHKTLTLPVEIAGETVVLDAVLEELVVSLGEVKVKANQEDYAYTVMRKTMAMAPFHQKEIAAYTARTYVKGTLKLRELSGMMKLLAGKKLEKETGIKTGQTYVLESINDYSFKQPGTVKEKVISNRSNFPPQIQQNSGNLITFGNLNFYNPKAAGEIVSPLSPSAFSYYRFKYEGSFQERGVTVNKIQVTPRSPGPNLLSGKIYIIEDLWAIHSLDLNFQNENGKYTLRQLYSPFKEVWMPVYFDFGLELSILGINLDGRYLTNVRNYDLTVDSRYHRQPVVVDEKIEKEEAQVLKKNKIDPKTAQTQQALTRKQLRRLAGDLEKESRKERKAQKEDVSVVEDYSIEVDTLAAKRNNDFWNTERQVPLTNLEVKGYSQADSLNKLQADKIKKDSIRNLPVFKFSHLLLGHTYNYGRRDPLYGYSRRLTYTSPLSMENANKNSFYNSVEGYHLNAGLNYLIADKSESRLEVFTFARYAFARQRLNGVLGLNYSFDQLHDQIGISAGRFVQQFNPQNPIPPDINTSYSLFTEQNFMKLYEKTFVNITANKRFSEQVSFLSHLEFARRDSLGNNHFTPWINLKDRVYSSNQPVNTELPFTGFQSHNSLIFSPSLRLRPFAAAGKFNGREYTINRNKPVFNFNGRFGLLEESRFSQLEFAYDQTWELQRLGDLRLNARIGTFLDKPQYFMDFKHFNGNQTIFTQGNFESFRNLDYYTYSTAQSYLEVHAQNTFQQFLLTQFTALRLTGFKENLFLNYMNAYSQDSRYAEIGYGLTGGTSVLGLGVEVGGSFFNETYKGFFFRVKLPLQ